MVFVGDRLTGGCDKKGVGRKEGLVCECGRLVVVKVVVRIMMMIMSIWCISRYSDLVRKATTMDLFF